MVFIQAGRKFSVEDFRYLSNLQQVDNFRIFIPPAQIPGRYQQYYHKPYEIKRHNFFNNITPTWM